MYPTRVGSRAMRRRTSGDAMDMGAPAGRRKGAAQGGEVSPLPPALAPAARLG
jgi:hypothetical protein